MRVMITGATGFIGSHLLRALLNEGCDVVACARNVKAVKQVLPEADTLALDFAAPCSAEQLAEQLNGFDTIINTVGIIAETRTQTFDQLHRDFPECLFRACELAGVRRVIQISALGAGPAAVSKYHVSKNAADLLLKSLALESIIVKPSIVYGAGGKSTAFFRALAALPVHVLIDHGRQQLQLIHIDDLLVLLVKLTKVESLPWSEIEAVGPQPILFKDMLADYRNWLGFGQFCTVSIPWKIMLTAARFSGRLSVWLSADNLRMLQQDNIGDATQISALLGRAPVSFKTVLQNSPSTEAERWHARLYFLLPLLRVSVALVWIFSGLTSAFFFPVEESYGLLARVGLSGAVATMSLYAAAAIDIFLGIAVLTRFRPILTGLAQLLVMLSYTVMITLFLSEFWLHPFGPIIKNIPFLVAILMLMTVEKK